MTSTLAFLSYRMGIVVLEVVTRALAILLINKTLNIHVCHSPKILNLKILILPYSFEVCTIIEQDTHEIDV